MISHIEIKNKLGVTLRGYLNRPENAKILVVFFHGFTGDITEHNQHFKKMSLYLEKEGIASLRIGYTGCAESDGTYLDYDFSKGLDDAKAILDYASSLEFEVINVLGFSMGGMITSALSNYIEIRKIILWSPSADDRNKWNELFVNSPKNDDGYMVGGILVSANLLSGIELYNCKMEAKKFMGDVLIVQGASDEVVGTEPAIKLSEWYKYSHLELIPNALHGYERIAEQHKLYSLTLDFILNN